MPEQITATRSELAAAFTLWAKKFKESPQEFARPTDGEVSADYLVTLLEEVRAGR